MFLSCFPLDLEEADEQILGMVSVAPIPLNCKPVCTAKPSVVLAAPLPLSFQSRQRQGSVFVAHVSSQSLVWVAEFPLCSLSFFLRLPGSEESSGRNLHV